MSQNTLEIEVQGVDEIGVVHQQIFLSECWFFGLGFVGFHDGVKSSWHEDLIGFVDIIENDLQIRWVRGSHVNQVLIVEQLQWLTCAVKESLLSFWSINNEVEIEWHNVVSHLKGMVQMEILIPCVKEFLIHHSELVESYLG